LRSLRAAPLRSLGAAALFACAPSIGLACSASHIVAPLQLVADADAIVRVRAVATAAGPASLRTGPYSQPSPGPVPMVAFEILEIVHGATPARPLRVVGVAVGADDWNDQVPPYDFVRPAGRKGRCHATEYRLGAQYLMFFRRGSVYWSPLAPTNEQVRGANDPWVAWVKRAVAQGQPAAKP
jgi:hypothetical protein